MEYSVHLAFLLGQGQYLLLKLGLLVCQQHLRAFFTKSLYHAKEGFHPTLATCHAMERMLATPQTRIIFFASIVVAMRTN